MSKPKSKIYHVTSLHSRNDVRIFIKECSSLSVCGHDVSLIVADGLGDDNSGDIKIIDVGKNSCCRLLKVFFTTLRILKIIAKTDSVAFHFHDPELIPVGLLLKIKGKKVIYDVHEDIPKQILSKDWIPLYARKILSCSFNKFEKNLSRFFDVVITATPAIREKFMCFNKRATTINNYPLLQEMSTNVSWANKKRAVCYMGGITKIRGLDFLVRSMEFVDCDLILAGKFFDATFEEEIRSLKGWEKVDYRGLVDRKQIFNILESSMAGVVTFLPVPNHIDAQPNKMFEYMSAGIPVIASNFPLWREIVEGNKCGLCVDPSNVQEIAKAITYITSDVFEAQTMGSNGRKAVINKYNWGSEEKKLIEVYNKLL